MVASELGRRVRSEVGSVELVLGRSPRAARPPPRSGPDAWSGARQSVLVSLGTWRRGSRAGWAGTHGGCPGRGTPTSASSGGSTSPVCRDVTCGVVGRVTRPTSSWTSGTRASTTRPACRGPCGWEAWWRRRPRWSTARRGRPSCSWSRAIGIWRSGRSSSSSRTGGRSGSRCTGRGLRTRSCRRWTGGEPSTSGCASPPSRRGAGSSWWNWRFPRGAPWTRTWSSAPPWSPAT